MGPVTADETRNQTPSNLTGIPIQVEIGGVSATVTYHGRSVYPGVDQVNVIVPPGVSGCYVSVVVVAGGVPGNFATIPVASSGRICSDLALTSVTAGDYGKLLGLDNVNVGAISLVKLTAGAVTSDSAYALLQQIDGSAGQLSRISTPAVHRELYFVRGWGAASVFRVYTAGLDKSFQHHSGQSRGGTVDYLDGRHSPEFCFHFRAFLR